MLQHLEADRKVDPVGRIGEEKGTDGREGCAKDRADDEKSGEHIERAETLLDDDLVDDDLDDHRIRQGEDLDEEGGDDHLQEGSRVLPDVGDEGTEPEGLSLGGAGALRKQNQIALLPSLGNFIPIDPLLPVLGFRRHRIGYEKTMVGNSLDHHGYIPKDHQKRMILITQ